MEKNIRMYRQRGDTCAIACMMMVLEYYGIIEKATWYDERRFYKIYGSKYIPGTPFSAVAYHFAKNGLLPSVYHEDKNLFCNDEHILDEEEFKLALEEYKEFLERAVANGAKVVSGIEINTSLIKAKLREENMIILAGRIPGGYHAILIVDYNNDKFVVYDPLYKNEQFRTEQELSVFMNTNIGKWLICVHD